MARYCRPAADALSTVIGRYISDLSQGDVLDPVSFVISATESERYASGFGETARWFRKGDAGDQQYVPPTAIQALKIRLLKKMCPAGDGPHPKLITQYDAKHVAPIPVGKLLTVSGEVTDRYEKRGRTYLRLRVELRETESMKLLVEYTDEQLLKFALENSG